MPWTPIDDLTLDDQVAKMIGPIPPSPFSHRKIEIRKLQVAGYNGFKKNIQEEFNVEFKSEYQIGNGRFGKVYRGTSLDNSTVFAFKGTQESLISNFMLPYFSMRNFKIAIAIESKIEEAR